MKSKSYLRKKWEEFFLYIVKKRIPESSWINNEVLIISETNDLDKIFNKKKLDNTIKIVLVSIPLNNFDNLVDFFKKIETIFSDDTKIIINYYSIIWRPFFYIMSKLGITNYFKNECYFSKNIFEIFLSSTSYEISHYIDEPPIPINIFGITNLFYLVTNLFPFLKFLSVTKICYLKKKNISEEYKIKKVSIIIPCKNEENNIVKIIENSKQLEFFYELIFIDDKSEDLTKQIITREIEKNKDIKIKIVSGEGLGKYKAVRLGIKNSSGFYIMIFDADITVEMKDLNLFYKAISEGRGDLINGSRLIYKPYAGAMKLLNYFGNLFFAYLVSYITKVRVTDTLCGTKCFKLDDIRKFDEFEKKNKIIDLWGDFNILFAASFYGLKIIDLPIRYRKREEGETKMNKRYFFFKNMFKTCFKAFIRFKYL